MENQIGCDYLVTVMTYDKRSINIRVLFSKPKHFQDMQKECISLMRDIGIKYPMSFLKYFGGKYGQRKDRYYAYVYGIDELRVYFLKMKRIEDEFIAYVKKELEKHARTECFNIYLKSIMS